MASPVKRAFDITELRKQISERQAIVSNYINFGFIDRDDAIRKITDSRTTDTMVQAEYQVRLGTGFLVPLENCPDDQLIHELRLQISTLQSELAEKLNEESEYHAHP